MTFNIQLKRIPAWMAIGIPDQDRRTLHGTGKVVWRIICKDEANNDRITLQTDPQEPAASVVPLFTNAALAIDAYTAKQHDSSQA